MNLVLIIAVSLLVTVVANYFYMKKRKKQIHKLEEKIAVALKELHAPTTPGSTSLHEAAKNGDMDAVLHFIKDGAEIDKKDAYSHTPMFWAVQNDHLAIAALLKAHGAEPCRKV